MGNDHDIQFNHCWKMFYWFEMIVSFPGMSFNIFYDTNTKI